MATVENASILYLHSAANRLSFRGQGSRIPHEAIVLTPLRYQATEMHPSNTASTKPEVELVIVKIQLGPTPQ